MLKSITLLLLFGGILELAHSSEEDYTWVCLNLLSGQAVSEKSTVDNILFLGGNYFKITKEGQAIKVDELDIQAEAAFVLGGVNDPDVLHSGWGGGDGFRNFFLGDKTGQIKIAYKSGTTDVIPLIFGYSVFCSHNYRMSPEPFRSDPIYREMLDRSLFVANALDGYKNSPETYYLKIALRNEPVASIELQDSVDKIGFPVIRAITFSEVSNIETVEESKFIIEKGAAISNEKQEWLKSHTILSENPYPTECQIAIKKFQQIFYTSKETSKSVGYLKFL
jgi:hypothetical protein